MSDVIFDQYGVPRKVSDLHTVNHFFTLKEKNGSNPWPVIEEVVKYWAGNNPQEWKSFLVEVEEMRHTRTDEFAASKPDEVHGGILRYTLDIPEKVVYMIRSIYKPDELPFNREFYQEFAKRFPDMKVAEKL